MYVYVHTLSHPNTCAELPVTIERFQIGSALQRERTRIVRYFQKNTTSPPQRDFSSNGIVYDLPVICREGGVGDVSKGSRVECVCE